MMMLSGFQLSLFSSLMPLFRLPGLPVATPCHCFIISPCAIIDPLRHYIIAIFASFATLRH
jgi:hypothetical protein